MSSRDSIRLVPISAPKSLHFDALDVRSESLPSPRRNIVIALRFKNRECTSACKSNIVSGSRRTPLAAHEKVSHDSHLVVKSRVTTTAFISANRSKAPLKLAMTLVISFEKVESDNLTKPEIESGAAVISSSASQSKVAPVSSTIPLAYAENPLEPPRPAYHAISPCSPFDQHFAIPSQSTILT